MLLNYLQLGGSYLGGAGGGGGSVSAPAAVSNLSGTGGDTEAVMSWSEPADNGSPITDYIVQYREKP